MNALRTLVVEGDAVIGRLLAETLEGLGHKVCAVETNVARAVAAASRPTSPPQTSFPRRFLRLQRRDTGRLHQRLARFQPPGGQG
jgi:CheY-like chemotaxis protein